MIGISLSLALQPYGSGAFAPPAGFVFLVDDDGAYLLDDDGAFLLVEE